MRKIEKRMVDAIMNGENFVCDNTSVVFLEGGQYRVRLHGNWIASGARKGKLPEVFNFCGWNTSTTRSRLRALGCDLFREHDGHYSINGKRIADFSRPISCKGNPRDTMEIGNS